MMLMTPGGPIDLHAIQQRAASQLTAGQLTDDIKMAVGLLATVIDELNSQQQRIEALREVLICR